MSLTEIEYGSLLDSKQVNDNFKYLDDRIDELVTIVNDTKNLVNSSVSSLNANLLSLISNVIPVGTILVCPSETIPVSTLLCDGSSLLITNYEALYEVIGTTFGAADSTHFNLPDLRNVTLWGSGDNSIGTILQAGLPNITGSFKHRGGNSSASGAFYLSGTSNVANYDTGSTDSSFYLDASRSSSIYGNSNTVQPPAVVVNFVIRYE